MPQKKQASQIVVLLALIIGCLVLATPLVAMKGWGYIYVSDTFGSSLKLKLPANLKTIVDTSTGLLTFGTSQEALDLSSQSQVATGHWVTVIGTLPPNIAQGFAPENQNVTPQIIIDALTSRIIKSVAEAAFDPSERITINHHAAVRVAGTSPQGDVVLIAVDMEEAYLITTALTAFGEKALLDPILLSILESAEYTP